MGGLAGTSALVAWIGLYEAAHQPAPVDTRTRYRLESVLRESQACPGDRAVSECLNPLGRETLAVDEVTLVGSLTADDYLRTSSFRLFGEGPGRAASQVSRSADLSHLQRSPPFAIAPKYLARHGWAA